MNPGPFNPSGRSPRGLPLILRCVSWSRLLAAIALLSGLAWLLAESTPGDTTSSIVKYTASEDIFVKDSSPKRNYGESSTLQADNSPSVKRILIRFQITGIPEGASVTSARLSLFVANGSAQAGTVHAVEGDWSEAFTAWSNAPL